jgi:tetratricopeptide (TPR) repeat protein|tara:strand:- start:3 stop:434 length:432 start_codon:yes stop_codon:yes gene_type:complete
MKKLLVFLIISLSFFGTKVSSSENFFNNAKNLYDQGKMEESKFLFQRNIVFNPKDSQSYLYLAKIYQTEENEKEMEKNLNTTLLLKPDSEEAMYMLIDIRLKKSDFDQVKELKDKFAKICNELCSKIDSIEERLKNMEAKNES